MSFFCKERLGAARGVRQVRVHGATAYATLTCDWVYTCSKWRSHISITKRPSEILNQMPPKSALQGEPPRDPGTSKFTTANREFGSKPSLWNENLLILATALITLLIALLQQHEGYGSVSNLSMGRQVQFYLGQGNIQGLQRIIELTSFKPSLQT